MTPEQRAWQAAFREMGGLWLIQRFEDRYSPDIPDAHFCYGKYAGWVEMKAAKHNEPLKLRPGQINWLYKRHTFQPCLLIWRVLDDAGRHLEWGGIAGHQMARLKGQRPTPDDIGALVEPTMARTFRGVLDGLLEIPNEKPLRGTKRAPSR